MPAENIRARCAILTATTLFLAFLLACAQPALAHRVNVFAYEEGGTIKIETSFSGGGPAMNSPIEVQNAADGTVLLTAVTNAEGLYEFPIPEAARAARADLRVVLSAGQGHRGEWIIRADEYLGADAAQAEAAAPAPEAAPVAAPAAGSVAAIDEAALTRIVTAAVDKQLAPMRRSLAAMAEPGPSAQDVFAGLGYILGLFGIAAWARSRRNAK